MENKLNNITLLLKSMEKQIIEMNNRIVNIEKKINMLYFDKNPNPLNPGFPPFNPHNPLSSDAFNPTNPFPFK